MGPSPGPQVKVDGTAAKLLDFGAARKLDGENDEINRPRKTFVGTPEYAPPEQWTGGEVPASDLYSLGGTLFYMLTGRFPYEKEQREPFAYRDSHTNDPVLEVREYNAQVPPELSAVLKRMMAKDPLERGTGEELIAALKAILPREAATPPPPTRARSKPAPRASKSGASIPAAQKSPVKSRDEENERNPVYRLTDSFLARLERAFIPGHYRPPPGSEAPLPERLASLIRRPLVLVLSLLLLALFLYGLYSLR